VDKKLRIKQIFKLYGFYAKLDLAWLLRDTKYAIMAITADTISSIASVSGIFLLAMRFNGVGGMDKYEVLFMLGYVTMLTGLFQLFFSMNNVGHISRRIGRGQLSHMFIQPLPMSVQLTTEGFIPFTGSSNFACSIVIIIVALTKLGISPPLWWITSFVFNVLISISIILCQSYLFSCAAFYAPVACEEIATIVIDELGSLGNYPLSGMPKWISTPLITILPYGLLGWFPSMVLLGKSPFNLPHLYPVVVAGVLFILAYFVFKKGFNHYVKTGSNRYSSMGHRR
jgi:ABC-2 type transport system permease protein